MSYPTTSLQPGATGTAVKQLQDFLVSQGFMTQAQVNTGYGTYGNQTTAAVAAYQQAHGVDNSSGVGYWGPKTIAAASGTSTAPSPATTTYSTGTAPAPVQTSQTQASSAPAAPTSSNPSLWQSLSGTAEDRAQYASQPDAANPYSTRNVMLRAFDAMGGTAKYGDQWINSPKFKADYAALSGQGPTGPAIPQTPAVTVAGGPPSVNLQPGSSGEAVKALQDYLVSLGAMTQAEVDTGYGTYGPKTQAAVAKIQQALGVDNSSGVGFWGPRTIAAVQQLQAQPAPAGTAATGTGIQLTSTGDPALDAALKGIKDVADGLVGSGYSIPANLQITPDLVRQFLGYAHQAVDPYTKQLIDGKLQDINSSLDNIALNFKNSTADVQAKFGTDLATEQNSAGNNGTAFSGLRQLTERNMANSANRDLSTLSANAGLNLGTVARSGASDVGAANAPAIKLPELAGGSVGIEGGSRGTTGTTGSLAVNYDPSIYTVGTIPSAGTENVNKQQQSYLSQYGTLAGLQSNAGRSASDLIAMMSGLPGATPSITPTASPTTTAPKLPEALSLTGLT